MNITELHCCAWLAVPVPWMHEMAEAESIYQAFNSNELPCE